MAIFGSLDYLFRLQGFPTQIIHHFPAISLTTYFDSLSSRLSIPIDQSMSNNLLRIASFSNFPRHVNIFTSLLSKAGFYYTGNEDEVRCYACGITHKNWSSKDDPIKIYQELSPNCPHLISSNSDDLTRVDERPHQSAASSLVGNSGSIKISPTNSTTNTNTVARKNTSNNVLSVSQYAESSNSNNNDSHQSNSHLDTIAAKSVLEMGYSSDEVLHAIQLLNSSNPDTKLLLEENKQLRDQRLCKVCLEFDACITFLPCGHLVCCSNCSPAMEKCPICRAHVKDSVKTFLA